MGRPAESVPDPRIVQADFDRLAAFEDERWNHNTHYHRFLLRRLPPHCAAALDLGCGAGAFSRLLARRADHLLALDLSPEMIRLATERAHGQENIDFLVADAQTWTWPTARFDCISTIATLHHLPMSYTLTRMREALKPGGTLLVLDLFQADGPIDLLLSALAIPLNIAFRLFHNGPHRPSPQERAAWAEHGSRDIYPTMAQVRAVRAELLPGATVRRHLFWRYSIVWRKP